MCEGIKKRLPCQSTGTQTKNEDNIKNTVTTPRPKRLPTKGPNLGRKHLSCSDGRGSVWEAAQQASRPPESREALTGFVEKQQIDHKQQTKDPSRSFHWCHSLCPPWCYSPNVQTFKRSLSTNSHSQFKGVRSA